MSRHYLFDGHMATTWLTLRRGRNEGRCGQTCAAGTALAAPVSWAPRPWGVGLQVQRRTARAWEQSHRDISRPRIIRYEQSPGKFFPRLSDEIALHVSAPTVGKRKRCGIQYSVVELYSTSPSSLQIDLRGLLHLSNCA